ncbi:MAG: hypothetical protein GY845_30365 [Planctomycetes bacterium]|nr:hypothetical protein [Planctomycetota bacterium]
MRAKQFNILLAGLRDSDGAAYGGYTLYFYEAGTTTAKEVWTEKEKTCPYVSWELGPNGAATLYGEGVYKIILKDSDGSTVNTWDDYKVGYGKHVVSHTASNNYVHKKDDDEIVIDAFSGNKAVSLLPASEWERPLRIRGVFAPAYSDYTPPYRTVTILPYHNPATGTTETITSLPKLSRSNPATLLSSDGTDVDMIHTPPIVGGGLSLVLRSMKITIADGTGADTVKLTITSIHNGHTLAETDNVGKSYASGGVFVNSAGTSLYLNDTIIPEISAGILDVSLLHNTAGSNRSALASIVNALVPAAGHSIRIRLTNDSAAAQDLTALTAVDSWEIRLTYLTKS